MVRVVMMMMMCEVYKNSSLSSLEDILQYCCKYRRSFLIESILALSNREGAL